MTKSDDLISRQAAIDALAELQGKASTKAELKGISKMWKRIKKLPSAEREKGEWVDDVAYYDEAGCPCIVSRCNRCGGVGPISNFCPNCGADMRKEKNDGIR